MASRIAGITVEIGGNVGPLTKALESVNKVIKNTQNQLKDVERLLKLDPTNTQLLTQKQALLKDSISATKEKLEALKTAQEQAKAQMENGDLGKDKYDALQREIIATEQELERLAKEAANANAALNKLDSVGQTLQDVGNKMAGVGKTLTTNVTTPIVAIGAAAVKTTADFDAQMSKVQAISGATGDEFDALREKAREMGAKTKSTVVRVEVCPSFHVPHHKDPIGIFVHIPRHNGRVGIFLVVLRHRQVRIRGGIMLQMVCRVILLHQGIAHILFIPDDAFHRSGIPLSAGFNGRWYVQLVQSVRNLCGRSPIQVHLVDFPYNRCLLLVDSKYPAFKVVVTVDLADLGDAQLETLANAASHVLADGEGFLLGEGCVNREQQLRFNTGGVQVLLLENHPNTKVPQFPNCTEHVHRVPAKTGNGLHQNLVNLAVLCILQHSLECDTLLGAGAGSALVRVNLDQLPIRMLGNQAVISFHLGIQAGLLYFDILTYPAVRSHTKFLLFRELDAFSGSSRCADNANPLGDGGFNHLVILLSHTPILLYFLIFRCTLSKSAGLTMGS